MGVESLSVYILLAIIISYCIYSEKYNQKKLKKRLSLFWCELKNKLIYFNACETYANYITIKCPGRTYIHDPLNINIDELVKNINEGKRINRDDLDVIQALLLYYVKTAICIKQVVEPVVMEYIAPLLRQEKTLITKDVYGDMDYSQWNKEAKHFLEKKLRTKIEDWHSFNSIGFTDKFLFLHAKAFSHSLSNFSYDEDEYLIGLLVSMDIVAESANTNISAIEYSENFTGHEYEHFVSEIINELGYESYVTKGSGDQGVDVIAEVNNYKIAIQCKHYNSKVSNKAIQEIHAAKGIYDCDFALVVSNNDYTKSAREAAAKLDVNLLHHEDIPAFIEWIEENYPAQKTQGESSLLNKHT